jgi:hypothetical protein
MFLSTYTYSVTSLIEAPRSSAPCSWILLVLNVAVAAFGHVAATDKPKIITVVH